MNPSSLIGNWLHHKGRIIDIRQRAGGIFEQRELPFLGYSDLLTAFPLADITVTENPDGSLSISSNDAAALTHELWAIGTNLLCSPNSSNVVADLKAGFTINNISPANPDAITPPVREKTIHYRRSYASAFTEPDSFGILDYTGTTEVDLGQRVLRLDNIFPSEPFPIHSETVADVLTLDMFGDPETPGQDTDYGKYINRKLVLTPWGLTLVCELVVPMSRPLHTTNDGFPTERDYWPPKSFGLPAQDPYFMDDKLVYQIAIRFTGYQWPSETSPAFISPRKKRILTEAKQVMVSVWEAGEKKEKGPLARHPNISAQSIGEYGKDYEIISLPKDQLDKEKTDVSILTPLQSHATPTDAGTQSSPFDFPLWPNPDNAADFLDSRATYAQDRRRLLDGNRSSRVLRLNGFREHYNCIANYVNAFKQVRPYDLFMHRFVADDGSTYVVRPDQIGPFGTSIRPRHHFASVTEGSAIEQFAIKYNVPIKRFADLPRSLRDLKNVKTLERAAIRQVNVEANIMTRTPVGPGSWNYTLHAQFRSPAGGDRIVGESGNLLEALDSEALRNYRWVTIQDVKAKAESLGFVFHMQRLVVPIELKVFTIGPAKDLFTSTDVVEFDETGELAEFLPLGLAKSTFNVETSYQGRVPRFVEAQEDDKAEWIWDEFAGQPVYLVDHKAGDVLTLKQDVIRQTYLGGTPDKGIAAIYQLDADTRYLRDIPELNFWKPLNRHISGNQDIGAGVASLLVQVYHTDDVLSPEPSLILTNSDCFAHDGDDFSTQSYTNAIARLLFGSSALPVTTSEAPSGSRVIQINDEETFIEPDPGGVAQRATLNRGWPMTFS